MELMSDFMDLEDLDLDWGYVCIYVCTCTSASIIDLGR